MLFAPITPCHEDVSASSFLQDWQSPSPQPLPRLMDTSFGCPHQLYNLLARTIVAAAAERPPALSHRRSPY